MKKVGEQLKFSKLTKKDVLEIRSKYIPKKYFLETLADEYGVHRSTIHNVVKRVSWKHLRG